MVRRREPFFTGKRLLYAFSAIVLTAFSVVGMLVSSATQIITMVLPEYAVDATIIFADISSVVCCSMIAVLIFTRLLFRRVPGWTTAIPFGVMAACNVGSLIFNVVMDIVTCVYGHYDFLYLVELAPSWVCIALMAATNVIACVWIAKRKTTRTYLPSIFIVISLLVALISDFVMAIVFKQFGWDLVLICFFNVVLGVLGGLAYFLICYSLAHEDPPYCKPHGEGYFYLVTHIVLLVLTFGIWTFVWIYKQTKDLEGKGQKRDARTELLLCILVPFYVAYWCYQTAKIVDGLAKEKGLHSDLAIIATVTAVFLAPVSTAVLQYKRNEIADAKPPRRQQPIAATAETATETTEAATETLAETAAAETTEATAESAEA